MCRTAGLLSCRSSREADYTWCILRSRLRRAITIILAISSFQRRKICPLSASIRTVFSFSPTHQFSIPSKTDQTTTFSMRARLQIWPIWSLVGNCLCTNGINLEVLCVNSNHWSTRLFSHLMIAYFYWEDSTKSGESVKTSFSNVIRTDLRKKYADWSVPMTH